MATSTVSEAVERRHATPIVSATIWALLCGALVLVAHQYTHALGERIGVYWTGLVTLILFLVVAAYSWRKRSLWLSLRILRTMSFLPSGARTYMVTLDRLESWRRAHICLGVLSLLPFWWHMQAGMMSPLEAVLASVVALLMLSGLFGTIVQDLLPIAMHHQNNLDVRIIDAETHMNALYVEAEELILGHPEALVQAYLKEIKPILTDDQPRMSLLLATLAGRDPAPAACAPARPAILNLGDQAAVYSKLLDIAGRKVRVEHNLFNLRFSTNWLNFHIVVAAATGVLLFFHIFGALYFGGLK